MRASVASLALALWCAPAAAPAQEVYRLRLGVEAPFVVATLAVAGLPELYASRRPAPSCLPECDPASVNALDRWVIGSRSDLAEALSNVMVVALPVLGLGLTLADEQGAAFWQDTFVAVEAYAVHGLVVSLVKAAARRPRPYVYDRSLPADVRVGSQSTLSFFSGHSSSAFVTVVAFAETHRRRHEGASVVAVYAAGLTLATVVAACRILAGKHFLTDVLAGALVGTAFGLLMPALHDRRAR